MDDVGRVRDDEHLRNLLGDAHLYRHIEAVVERVVQASTVDELEDQPVAILFLDVIVDATDGRMVQLGENARLAQEARPRVRAQPPVRANGFQSHLALQRPVVAFEDFSHPALAQRLQDFVMGHDPRGGPRLSTGTVIGFRPHSRLGGTQFERGCFQRCVLVLQGALRSNSAAQTWLSKAELQGEFTHSYHENFGPV